MTPASPYSDCDTARGTELCCRRTARCGLARSARWRFIRSSACVGAAIICVVFALLKRACDQKELDNALIRSIRLSDRLEVEHLLNRGANPMALSTSWPGFRACLAELFSRVRLKAPTGAVPDHDALFFAITAERPDTKIIDALLVRGADPNVRDDFVGTDAREPTAILYMAATGNTACVDELAQHGADVEATDNDGCRVLQMVCSTGSAGSVLELLRKGADVNWKNKRGETPLLAAVEGWNAPVTKLLMDSGANRNVASELSETDAALKLRIDKLRNPAGQ